MIEIWYCDITQFNRATFDQILDLIPDHLKRDVVRYRVENDRICRLLARLLVKEAIRYSGFDTRILKTWNKGANGKPEIKEWMPFNISHSGEIVMVAFGGSEGVGVDVEFLDRKMELVPLLSNFCKAECDWILEDDEKVPERFFLCWARKEAVLKANGIGLMNVLSDINCMGDKSEFLGKTWFLHSLPMNDNYSSYLATGREEDKWIIKKIEVEHLIG
jgi:4'-phosphopantetheinyl transferase